MYDFRIIRHSSIYRFTDNSGNYFIAVNELQSFRIQYACLIKFPIKKSLESENKNTKSDPEDLLIGSYSSSDPNYDTTSPSVILDSVLQIIKNLVICLKVIQKMYEANEN